MGESNSVAEAQKPGADHGPPTITVKVFTPKDPSPKSFTWPKTMKVGDAAAEAAKAFGYEGGSPSFQNSAGVVLDRNKPLVAEGVSDGDELELVDAGGGV